MKIIAGAILINAASNFMVAGEDEMAVFSAMFGIALALWELGPELAKLGENFKPSKD